MSCPATAACEHPGLASPGGPTRHQGWRRCSATCVAGPGDGLGVLAQVLQVLVHPQQVRVMPGRDDPDQIRPSSSCRPSPSATSVPPGAAAPSAAPTSPMTATPSGPAAAAAISRSGR